MNPPEHWPAMLAELAEILSPETVLRLAKDAGGVDAIYIPKKAGLGRHQFEKILTREEWGKVVATYGGRMIRLPRGHFADKAAPKIIEHFQQGQLTNRQIALKLGVTERYVRRAISNWLNRGTKKERCKLCGRKKQ